MNDIEYLKNCIEKSFPVNTVPPKAADDWGLDEKEIVRILKILVEIRDYYICALGGILFTEYRIINGRTRRYLASPEGEYIPLSIFTEVFNGNHTVANHLYEAVVDNLFETRYSNPDGWNMMIDNISLP